MTDASGDDRSAVSASVDAVCDEFEGFWKAGSPRSIDAFVDRVAIADRPRLVGELAILEASYAERGGNRPDWNALEARLPQYAGAVRDARRRFDAAGETATWQGDRETSASGSAGPPRHRDSAKEKIPQHFGHFEIREILGRGAFGTVFRAYDTRIRRDVALKIPRGGAFIDDDHARRFIREAQAAGRLQHPSIIAVHDVGEIDGTVYIACEFIDGPTLHKKLADGYRPSVRDIALLVRNLAAAVHAAHAHGIIHRDLKPANILLDSEGKPHIADFGLARTMQQDSGLTQEGTMLGTPAYMSPEQAIGQSHLADARSDLWSLGVIFYELLTRRRPFEGDATLALDAIRTSDPAAPRTHDPRIPRDLQTICLKCLEKDPQRRYPSAQHLADDLERWCVGRPVHARRLNAAERFTRWVARNRVLSASMLMVALAVILGLVGVTYQWRRAESARRETKGHLSEVERQRNDAKSARDKERSERQRADEELFQALLSETRAIRVAREPRWRERAVSNLGRALGQARKAGMPPQKLNRLNSEAVACASEIDAYPIARLTGHRGASGAVRSLAFSQDGERIASVDDGGRMIVWDVENDRHLKQFKYPGAGHGVHPAEFHPRDDILLHSCRGKTVELLRLQQQKTDPPIQIALPGQVRSMSMDSLGKRLAVGYASDTAGQVRVFDMPGGQAIGEDLIALDWYSPVALSPDGRWLAAVGEKHVVKLYDLRDHANGVKSLFQHGEAIRSLCFSPDGGLLASASEDHNAVLWDLGEQRVHQILAGHTGRISEVAFSADAALVATAGDDDTLRIWDRTTGENILSLYPRIGPLCSVAFAPVGRRLVTANTELAVYELTDWKVRRRVWGHDYNVDSVVFHPHEAHLYSGSADQHVVKWDPQNGLAMEKWHAHPTKIVGCMAISPDGTLLAIGPHSYGNIPDRECPIQVLDATTGDVRHVLLGHGADVASLSFSPTAGFLASGARNGDCYVWDLSTGKPTSRWTRRGSSVQSVAFLRDGERLLFGEASGRLSLVRVSDGKTLKCAKHPAPLDCFVLSPDEERLAVGGRDGTIRVLAMPELTEITHTPEAHDGPVATVAYGAEGSVLASGGHDRRVMLWQFRGDESGQQLAKIATLPPETGRIKGLAFDAIGQRLAVGSEGELLTLWDLSRLAAELPEVGLDWPWTPGSAPNTQPLWTVKRRTVRAPEVPIDNPADLIQQIADLRREKRWDEIIPKATRAIAANLGDKSPYTALGEAQYQLGDYYAAAWAFRQHVALCPNCAYALRRMENCYTKLVDRLPPDHPGTADMESLAGAARVATGQYAAAEPLLLESHSVLRRAWGPRAGRTRDAGLRIVELYEAWQKDETAANYRKLLPEPPDEPTSVEPPPHTLACDAIWIKNGADGEWWLRTQQDFRDFDRSVNDYLYRGLRPRSVLAYGTPAGEVRHGGHWIVDATPFAVRHACTRQEYLDAYGELPDDYRPVWIDVDPLGDADRWSAIWVQDLDDRSWQLRSDLTQETFRSERASLGRQGFRPAMVEGHVDREGRALFETVWIKDDARFEVQLGLTATEFETRSKELAPDFRPAWIDAYATNGLRRYAVIWVESEPAAQTTTTVNVPLPDWQRVFDAQVADGWRLALVDVE